jgi:CBS domain containing-hemolysin-like protein
VLILALDLAAIGARMSFLQISHARLLSQRDRNGGSANATLTLLPVLPRVRASLNLLLVFTRFALAGLALYLLLNRSLSMPVLWGAITLLILALILFWFEWLVERIISRRPELWAIRMTGFVRIWVSLMGILLSPLSLSSESQSASEVLAGAVTHDELKTLVDAGQEEGVFEQGERQMIYSIFELGETLAREIMIPRIDMQALDVNTPLVEAVGALLDSGHSRAPVYEENVDNILGLLYAKELLRAWREDLEPTSLRGLLRPAYFVPEAKKVDELLAEMQSQRIHMAIVVDEYGGVAGLVTLEDIVEEILGEIQDEYDVAEEAPFQQLADGGYLFLGRIDLDDFNEIMESNLSSEEADSLGGYIYHRLGHVPGVGEEVRAGNLVLTVEQVTGRRIKKVSARWSPPAQMDDEEDKERVDR